MAEQKIPGGWGKVGFTRVDEATYRRRTGACEVCPHLKDPPDRHLQTPNLHPGEDLRVCALAGAVASRMARLPANRCPDADPANPSTSRWGEPI